MIAYLSDESCSKCVKFELSNQKATATVKEMEAENFLS